MSLDPTFMGSKLSNSQIIVIVIVVEADCGRTLICTAVISTNNVIIVSSFPQLNLQRCPGVPRDQLIEVSDPATPGAMIATDGTYVIYKNSITTS